MAKLNARMSDSAKTRRQHPFLHFHPSLYMFGPHLNCLIAASAIMLMLLAAPAFAEDEVEFLNGSKIKGTVKEIRKDKKVHGEGNDSKFSGEIITIAATILSASRAPAEEPELSPKANLARGLFQHAVINRDETRLLTTTKNLAQLWDLKTGEMLQQFEGHAAMIHSICFSPDERQILTGAGRAFIHGPADATVRLWDVDSGKELAVYKTAGHPVLDEFKMSRPDRMISARFTPDNQQVFAASDTSSSIPDAVIFWNRKTKKIDLVVPGVSTLSEVTHSYEPGQLSPDGRWFVVLYAEGLQVRALDARTGELRWQVACPQHEVAEKQKRGFGSLQISPDGLSVLAVCSDRTVRIWNAETGRETHALAGHTENLSVARFSTTGKHVVTASEDRTVRLWDIQSGKQLQRWEYAGPVQELAVSADGQRLLTRTVQHDPTFVRFRLFGELRNLKSGESIRKWELPLTWLAENQTLIAYRSPILSPSGRLVLTTVWTDGEVGVILIDAETGDIKKNY